MKPYWSVIFVILIIAGCQSQENPIAQNDFNLTGLTAEFDNQTKEIGEFIPWGYYQLEIARDGTDGEIIPLRSANYDYYTYGHHINALKFLEGSPCTNCVWLDNIHLTSEGNVSVDISIKHPFDNPCFTGFDVRGIIMFPAHRFIPDDNLRAVIGWPPFDGFHHLYSSSETGDAELVNNEGLTTLWAPDATQYFVYTETGYPIFYYYEGKFASGENIGSLNPFIRFHSTETRHMFEVGKTVTRTYIIKPPAQGPIEACYAVYAHWAEPDVLPVTNPETDFPLIANSSMPYEIEYYQDGIIDPDAPPEIQAESIHIHMKHWGIIPVEEWSLRQTDFIEGSLCVDFEPHPSGQSDDYWPGIFYPIKYYLLPDSYFPGTLPILYRLKINDPISPFGIGSVGNDYCIMDIEFGPRDGVW